MSTAGPPMSGAGPPQGANCSPSGGRAAVPAASVGVHPMSGVRGGADQTATRRLEELSLNASGAFQSILYDGWLLGYRRGPTKRLRCVNPFYPSTLPLQEKVDHCTRFYADAGLPVIFRLLPFSEPANLDAWLERAGWEAFERTLVQRASIEALQLPSTPTADVTIMLVPEWQEPVARLLDVSPALLVQHVEQARAYPLPQDPKS